MKIGLVGKNGSGKSVVCDYLKDQKKYTVISLSDIVRETAAAKGLEATRDNLIATGNELKATFGQSILAERSIKKVKSAENVVFDSIRNVAEVKLLKKAGVHMIGIDAPIEVRYERIKQRQRASDLVDFDTFKKQDEKESAGQSSGQNLNASLSECEAVFQNNGPLENLFTEIETHFSK